jgi:uracil-DNA glycosylase
MESNLDRPKMLGDSSACAERLGELYRPHIARLTQFVEDLRRANPSIPARYIPYFDPWDGGVEAQILFLQEAPGPKAVASGFVSRNNPDETAKNVFLLSREAGIERKHALRWNIVPWYIGSGKKIRAATAADARAGMIPLLELLALLPRLRGVVLLGKKAQIAWSVLNARRPDLRLFVSPHPSPLFCNHAPENRERILAVFREVCAFIDHQTPLSLAESHGVHLTSLDAG